MSESLLVLNAGSSSLKFRVYERTALKDWLPVANGQI
jgi:acetate kinase